MNQGDLIREMLGRILMSLVSSLIVSSLIAWLGKSALSKKILIPLIIGIACLTFIIIFKLDVFNNQEPLVEVPNLSHLSVDEAESILMKKELVPHVIIQATPTPGIEAGRVIPRSQSPLPGHKVFKGTKVEFSIADIVRKPPAESPKEGSKEKPTSPCLLDQIGRQATLKLAHVPAQEYAFDSLSFVAPYLRFLSKQIIRIDEPFSIQIGEVTIGEFRRYVKDKDGITRQQLGLGDGWDKDQSGRPTPENYPASSIPWAAANGYAKWKSQETSCLLQLPSRDEWAAAVIYYASFQSHRQSNAAQEIDNSLNKPAHLLGNLREWSRDECPDGAYLLGADYHTSTQDAGEDQFSRNPCSSKESMLRTFGFRLVRRGEASKSSKE